MPIDNDANLNDATREQIDYLDSTLDQNVPFRVLNGDTVASFSGADFVVLGYVPKQDKHVEDPEVGEIENDENRAGTKNFIEFANIQTMSVSSTRDVAAKRILGSAWHQGLSMGARSVAGTLAFLTVDGDALKEFKRVYTQNSREDAGDQIADTFPPFNIILSATNEHGAAISGALIGVKIVNTGLVVGTQDSYTEQTYSYVAKRWIPLRGIRDWQGNLAEIIDARPEMLDVIREAYSDPWKWIPPSIAAQDKLSRAIKLRRASIINRKATKKNEDGQNKDRFDQIPSPEASESMLDNLGI